MKLWKYPDAKTGELKPLPERDAGTGLEYNKVHAMIESFCMLYRMTGKEWYRDRIEKCEKFLRHRWREDAQHVEWNYRDFSGPWDYAAAGAKPEAAKPEGKAGAGDDPAGAADDAPPAGVNANAMHDGKLLKKPVFVHPKGRYYNMDVRAIVDVYNVGLVFSKKDMEELVKTNLTFMWNGDEGAPKFKTIAGKTGNGALWKSLAQFDPRVLKIWKGELDAFEKEKKGRRPGKDALDYLLAKSSRQSWEPLYAKEPAAQEKGDEKAAAK